VDVYDQGAIVAGNVSDKEFCQNKMLRDKQYVMMENTEKPNITHGRERASMSDFETLMGTRGYG
jgi:hypothetical protein